MNKPIIKLCPWVHKQVSVVQVHFQKSELILQKLRSLKNLRWSKSMACWYVPQSPTVVSDIFLLTKHLAYLDYSDLKNPTTSPEENEHSQSSFIAQKNCLPKLIDSEIKLQKLNAFSNWMKSRRYAESTIAAYCEALKTFLRFYHAKEISEITNEDLINFNNDYILSNHLSASFQNQVINAIKLFFKTVELKNMDVELIHRPKRAHVLPNVLSKEEVKLILNAHHNLKHKTILSLIYSCGLRRSEALNLALSDIDSKRGLIIVRQAKGKKDRVVPLSEKMLAMLRDYYTACKPKVWLFEGQDGKSKYDERSLASVLKLALEKCQMDKPVTLHWLRHSYATHLLEGGTDLRYIQEILGHSRSTTTEIYTHVSNKNIQRIISPFDSL